MAFFVNPVEQSSGFEAFEEVDSMEEMTESETTKAWLWVIEAMASFKEVSLSLIHDLVQEAPELPCGLAKNAKERIALRCLEELCVRQNQRKTGDVPNSSQDLKVEFDLSESCENVLQRVMQETSESDLKALGPNFLKWDIQSFVRHKKAHLPKLALEKLRDSILDGTLPYADILREESGYQSTNRNGEACKNAENQDSATPGPNSSGPERSSDPLNVQEKDKRLVENLQNGDFLPCKRRRSDSGHEDGACELENRNVMDGSDPHNENIKKAKLDVSHDSQYVEQNAVPSFGKEPQEAGCEKNVSVTIAIVGGSAEGEMGTVEKKGTVLEDGSDDCTVPKQSDDRENVDLCADEPEIQPNNEVTRQDTTTGEPCVNSSSEGPKDMDEVLPEPSGNPSVETVQESPTKEPKSSNEHDLEFQGRDYSANDGLQEKANASEVKESRNEDCEAEFSSDSDGYHKERTDVTVKKQKFLSSQVTDSTVHESSEKNLCTKCNEPGQALACGSENCLVVVHETCIGSLAIFDGKGNFYCPFCAYSRAITEYLEAKKRSSLAKKEVGAFIRKCSVENQPKGSTKKLKKKKKHGRDLFKDDDQSKEIGKNEENQAVTGVNEDSGRKDQSVTANNPQAESSVPCTNLEFQKIVEEKPNERGCEEQQNEVLTRSDLVNQRNKNLRVRHKDVKHQEVGSPKQLAREFSISSEGDDDTSISDHFIGMLTNENQVDSYPSITQSRRKKLPWTAEEEQKLKDAMVLFADDKKIPWKKVMEYGGDAFQEGRTPGDLKDKWRNMCRSQNSK